MYRLALAVSASLLLAACGGSTADTSSSTPDDKGVHWGYTGADGPDNWGDLSPDFAECSMGQRQSPIDIENPTPVARALPKVAYLTQNAQIVNNGHSVEATAGPGSMMTIDGTKYGLVRMHFHAPGENVLDGVQYPVELHFVHESRDGEAAVLAVMLEEGAANPAFDALLDHMDQPQDAVAIVQIPWQGLVPQNLRTVRFDGSLTTPECSEGIAWNVAVTPVQVSAEQIATFRSAYDDNARPVQPLNDREVTIDAA